MQVRQYAPFAVSAVLHLVLLSYANHVDTHPHKFGGLKYTDVDWRVVIDGAAHIFAPRDGTRAKGWLSRSLGWGIGE
jgi:phosphatidylinositol glycan class M